jgi:hypothetical protein
MLSRLLSRSRSASAIAAGLALLIVGAAAGAAGDALILGQSNDSGTAQTTLLNAGTGAAFTLKTTNVSTNATGIFGWSSSTAANVTRGVYGRADGPNSNAIVARQLGAVGSGAALVAEGNNNQGIIATSAEDTVITATATGCTGFLCGSNGVTATGYGFASGVYGTGPLAGVFGTTTAGFGVYGDQGAGLDGLYSAGDAEVTGDLTVGGTCTGCAVATLAINDSAVKLSQGQAVTVTGVARDKSGRLLLKVAPARAGDVVMGIVDAAMELKSQRSPDGKTVSVYKPAGTAVASGATLRVITGGIVTFARASTSGGAIAVGDSLTVSETAGTLGKAGAGAAPGTSIGYAVGELKEGRVAVYILPH